MHKTNKITLKLTVLIALCLSAITLFTQTAPHTHAQTGGTINLLGHLGGKTNAVFIDGNTAYIGMGPRLTILDIVDPANPALIGKTDPLPDVVEVIKVVGSVAYVTNGHNGLMMTVDVSDLTAPYLLGSYNTFQFANDLQVVGSVVYVAAGDSGLMIVDVSDPTDPSLIGSVNIARFANGVQVVGSVAYVVGSGELVTVDVSNPTAPYLLSSFSTAGSVNDVQVVGSVAYVADKDNGLVTVDVSDPTALSLIGSYDTTEFARDVQVVGNVAYMTDLYNGLVMVDVTDPTAPSFLGSYNTGGFAEGVQVVGSVAYVADVFNGLVTVDVSDPSAPTLLGSYNTFGHAIGMQVVGSVGYVANGYNGLVTVDVSNPTAPSFLGSYNTIGNARGVQVVRGVAYVADLSNGLVMVDVSDPTVPFFLGSYNTAGDAYAVQVKESVAYVADFLNGLVMVDVSDPTAPFLLGSVSTAGSAYDVEVVASVAYVADRDSGLLMTVDVSDPTAPFLLGSYNTPEDVYAVQVEGSVAYVAVGYNGLMTVDVSDPTDPSLIGSVNTPRFANGVQIVESIAYVVVGSDGLVTVDVSDPSVPSLLGSYNTAGYARGVEVVGSVVYVTNDSGGLHILEYVPPPPDGDLFEIDDGCVDASEIGTDGTAQAHTFHDFGDEDWIRFDVVTDTAYALTGDVPLTSSADLVVEIFPSCTGAVKENQGESFAPGIRMDFTAPTSGTYYARVYNDDPGTFGDEVAYTLSVKERSTETPQSAVIIVAGQQSSGDVLQRNIHHVTNSVYKMYKQNGHPDNRIQYLANDLELDPANNQSYPVDKLATLEQLEYAITTWATSRVDEDKALTLYMMSHGDRETFYLNENETVTSAQLNGWLTQLEDAVRNPQTGETVKINVIIDACYSGSFIDAVDTISKPGRMILASAGRDELAWASNRGALFSDFFTFALRNDYTVYDAFGYATGAARYAPWPQTPWLDDNGNGIPNDPDDGLEAAVRGFGFADSFGLPLWEPYIVDSDPVVQNEITVRVRDDKGEIDHVWAVLYEPSYTPPPTDSVRLAVDEQPTITLADDGGGVYANSVCPVMNGETGAWSAIVYAEDEDGLVSRPETLTFTITTDDLILCVPLAVNMSQENAAPMTHSAEVIGLIGMSAAGLLIARTVRLKRP